MACGLHLDNLQAEAPGRITLAYIRRNECLGLADQSRLNVDGIHAAQWLGFQRVDGLLDHLRRGIADAGIGNLRLSSGWSSYPMQESEAPR